MDMDFGEVLCVAGWKKEGLTSEQAAAKGERRLIVRKASKRSLCIVLPVGLHWVQTSREGLPLGISDAKKHIGGTEGGGPSGRSQEGGVLVTQRH